MRVRKEAELERCRTEAEQWIGELSDRDLLMFGAALYVGEGAKTERSALRGANTSAPVMRSYLRWLRSFFDIDEDRLRARLYLHEGLDLDAATAFWSEQLAIPIEQFQQPHRPAASRDAPIKHPYGCATVIYSSLSIHRRVMALTEAITSALDLPG